tara:strand:- start:1873 stop:2337 length:465 start_codon:yes stop_codon:yes gene_type:complete
MKYPNQIEYCEADRTVKFKVTVLKLATVKVLVSDYMKGHKKKIKALDNIDKQNTHESIYNDFKSLYKALAAMTKSYPENDSYKVKTFQYDNWLCLENMLRFTGAERHGQIGFLVSFMLSDDIEYFRKFRYNCRSLEIKIPTKLLSMTRKRSHIN